MAKRQSSGTSSVKIQDSNLDSGSYFHMIPVLESGNRHLIIGINIVLNWIKYSYNKYYIFNKYEIYS